MHEAVSGQRSRRPSLTPSARVARGLATNAAAAAAPTPRRRTTARGFAGDAAAVRGVVLRSDAHRLKSFVNCSAIQRCVYLRILTRLLRNLVDRASIFAAHLAGCMHDAQAARRRDGATQKVKQDMLLHKIGNLLGSAPAGQAPARRLYGARVFGAALPRDGSAPRGRLMLSRRCGA